MLDKSFYPGLNELRAIAVLSVVIGHIEQVKKILGLPVNYWYPIPAKWGVILFFVISGFLITALLLKEKEKKQTINLKKFYIRRVLRIWPLYFFIILISIFILNRLDFFSLPPYSDKLYKYLDYQSILLIVLVMPNYLNFIIPYASQTWSIGVEEQFYLIQPIVIKLVKKSSYLILFLIFIFFLRDILMWIYLQNKSEIVRIFFMNSTYFASIAIGSLGAIACFYYPKFVKKIIHSKITQILSFLMFIYFVYLVKSNNDNYFVDFRYLSILFIIIVINAATNSKSYYNLKSKFLDYIGRISYGIYIYHAISVVIALKIAEYIFANIDNNIITFNVVAYIATFIISIFFAYFSYKYFETPFLNLKKKYG